MTNMLIDIETYSDRNLKQCGVYKYVESPVFEILLFGVSEDGGPVKVYDLASGDMLPERIVDALVSDQVVKWAHNASFERICLSEWLRRKHADKFKSYNIPEDTVGKYLDPSSWRCTMVASAYLGLPLSLEGVGAVLKLQEQKLSEGKDLIRYFCSPCKPTKANGGRTRNLPTDAADLWERFIAYNERDVVTECLVRDRLSRYPVPDFVWDEYHLSEEINDRGIALDMQLVENAIRLDGISRDDIMSRLTEITGLENPNSVMQMREWLLKRGTKADSLDKKTVAALLKGASPELSEVLRLRQKIAKSSVKKYVAMENAVCSDGRARGMFQFLGANRTGRWAGRLIQLQNLPQNKMPDLAEARELVRTGDFEMLGLLYDDIPDTLSQLIRTAFIPKDGCRFYVADFSAIEARVIAHLAGETWRTEVFKNGGDIYCASASRMFHVPVEKHGINGHLRQKGKISELALGFGGSTGALTMMGATELGISEDELQPLVDAWRASNPHIVQLWWDVDAAAKTAIKQHSSTETHGLRFRYKSGMLFLRLPSGRDLCYVKPRIGENRFGGESITYEGLNAAKKWDRIESYGPKIVENIVQATSRDILAHAMETLRNCFICGHVHDELIIEADPKVSLEELCRQMSRTPDWIPGLVLSTDGYVTDFYRKD